MKGGPPLIGRFKAVAAPPVVSKIYGLSIQCITERIPKYLNSRWKFKWQADCLLYLFFFFSAQYLIVFFIMILND